MKSLQLLLKKKTNYIEILDNNIKCVIGGNNYNINDNNLLRIKEYINNNINELVHFSMLETNEYLKENMLLEVELVYILKLDY